MSRIFRVRVADCRFTLQGLSPRHLYPAPWVEAEEGPLVVSRLDSGEIFVHNGRHRVLRARLTGVDELDAVSLYDDDDTTPPADPAAPVDPYGRGRAWHPGGGVGTSARR